MTLCVPMAPASGDSACARLPDFIGLIMNRRSTEFRDWIGGVGTVEIIISALMRLRSVCGFEPRPAGLEYMLARKKYRTYSPV